MSPSMEQWRSRLIEAGLLLPTAAAGVYGFGAPFEAIVGGVARLVRDSAHEEVEAVRFPPLIASDSFGRTGYLGSFPELVGAVRSFGGGGREHQELLRRYERGEDWSDALEPAGVVLCSAVCHPLYPTVPSPLPDTGRTWELLGWAYRHEPDPDPSRLQAFRMQEVVHVGDPGSALAHRELWLRRAVDLLSELGLEVRTVLANDPFFGRRGALLATSQREQQLKFEILAVSGPGDEPTAVASSNYHKDHFGEAFGLRSADGATAHSSCCGFGLERITLALLWAHGLDPTGWDPGARVRLGLETSPAANVASAKFDPSHVREPEGNSDR